MSKPFANPFFEADISKLFSMPKMPGMPGMPSDFRMPEFSPEGMMAMQRKNIEAYSALSQAVFESFKGLWQRQADAFRQIAEEASQNASAIMSCPTPEEKVIRHAESSKAAMEKCLSSVCDIAETLAKCNSQALGTVSTRMNEGLDELRDIIKNNRAA